MTAMATDGQRMKNTLMENEKKERHTNREKLATRERERKINK